MAMEKLTLKIEIHAEAKFDEGVQKTSPYACSLHQRNHFHQYKNKSVEKGEMELQICNPMGDIGSDSNIEEINDLGHQDSNSGHDLFTRGWLKTGRRRGNGKALMPVPTPNDHTVMPVDRWAMVTSETIAREYLPPKKRLAFTMSSSSRDGSLSKFRSQCVPRELNNKDEFGHRVLEGRKTLAFGDGGSSLKIPSGAQKKHACSTCGKLFNNYRALGGHKAHCHVTKYENAICKSQGKGNGSLAMASTKTINEEKRHEDKILVHRCPFCDKFFFKGQALGGHKRHCQRHALDSSESKVLCLRPLVRQEMGTSSSFVFDFDLNELPPQCSVARMTCSKKDREMTNVGLETFCNEC